MLGEMEGREIKRGDKEEPNIAREKIKRIIRKLKDGKAERIDEMPGEVWRYGRKKIEGLDIRDIIKYGEGRNVN